MAHMQIWKWELACDNVLFVLDKRLLGETVINKQNDP